MIAGGTAVVSDVEAQSKVRGYPAMPMMLFNRMAVLQRKLPDLFKRFDQLEKRVNSESNEPHIAHFNNDERKSPQNILW
jgi:UDP-3-O-[3-hydroxymyristoyl] glucosamine N-acyltransferase